MNIRWKPSSFSGVVLIAITIACLFMVKHNVHGISKEIHRLNNAIMKEKEAIHILHAEWAFLTQPNKLAKLADKHLDLQPMAGKDIKRLSMDNLISEANQTTDKPGAN